MEVKTPEQMAEEYINHVLESQCDCSYRIAFLAGYKAAMESTEWQIRALNNLDELIRGPSEND